MKKILVPTDFSEQADYALELASHIAKQTGAEIYLMHVVEDVTVTTFKVTADTALPDMEEKIYISKLIKKTRNDIHEAANRYPETNIKTQIRVGSTYHNIKDIIVEQDVDLVVMGTKGATGLQEILVGSNAEKVVRYAKCPVLTLHNRITDFNFKNIVYASGLLEKDDQAIDIVKAFQKIFGSTIHLVRINTPNNFERDSQSYARMYKFVKDNNLENYTLQIFNDVTEEEGIIYFAEKVKADLIAMATHGRTGFAHIITGSIAEDVVNHSNRPVLTHVVKKH
ncbi:MAG: universal stress protein [Candidatus Cyclobacteriaceae bacterium M2_1C_046]